MDSMIEKVARALARAIDFTYDMDGNDQYAQALARAAIAAMRDDLPNDVFMAGVSAYFEHRDQPKSALECTLPVWHAMIDAALRDPA